MVQGFVHQQPSFRPPMQLEARPDTKKENLATALASTAIGWSLASQLAFASPTKGMLPVRRER